MFEVKFGLKIISVGFGLFYGQTENIFSLTQFIIPTKHAIFRNPADLAHPIRPDGPQTNPTVHTGWVRVN